MFEKFGDYMYSLLFTPLKKARKAVNQFFIFFKVVGKLFDDTKRDIFRVRREAIIITASEVMLTEHGRDREMPRLKGESAEGYRTRLTMKAIIAEKSGTVPGILLALSALGYEYSHIEPFYKIDPERWAEFIVFLRGEGTGVTDLRVIDDEVMKVKQASALPSYAREAGNIIETGSQLQRGQTYIPFCNMVICGVYPEIQAEGRHFGTGLRALSSNPVVVYDFPVSGGTAAAKQTYIRHSISEGTLVASALEARSSTELQNE